LKQVNFLDKITFYLHYKYILNKREEVVDMPVKKTKAKKTAVKKTTTKKKKKK